MINIIFDGNNLIHRTFHAVNKSGDPDQVVMSYCIQRTLEMMVGFYETHKADNVIIAFDSYSWRREYTADLSKCVTNKKYKGHRLDDKTPQQLTMRKLLEEHIEEFYEMLNGITSVLVLRGEKLEGDDLMAAYVRMNLDDTNVVVSGDKDMMQLLRYDNVKVVDPATGKERTLKDHNNDPDFFIFEKCIRGEAKKSDNVQSSYPRLTKVKMLKAMNDEYLMSEIMNHTFTVVELMEDGEYKDVNYVTKELFAENKLLMDLTKQPKDIQKRMVRSVLAAKEERNRYNHFKFIRYCHKKELLSIINRVESYVPMLACGNQFSSKSRRG